MKYLLALILTLSCSTSFADYTPTGEYGVPRYSVGKSICRRSPTFKTYKLTPRQKDLLYMMKSDVLDQLAAGEKTHKIWWNLTKKYRVPKHKRNNVRLWTYKVIKASSANAVSMESKKSG